MRLEPEWHAFHVEVDGRRVSRFGSSGPLGVSSSPKWLPLAADRHLVELVAERGGKGVLLSAEVDVGAGPTIVAVHPEWSDIGGIHPPLLEVYVP